jgi:quinoprotein glucose dehydrogenase
VTHTPDMTRLRPAAALVVTVALVAATATGCEQAKSDSAPRLPTVSQTGDGWPAYGHDAGGSRYSPLAQIDRSNVNQIREAWRYRTGEAEHEGDMRPEQGCGSCHSANIKFEATPILASGRLFVSTPANRVIALDPATGAELWGYNPELDMSESFSEGFVSRGVSHWRDRSGATGPCSAIVFLGTLDARLIALDATTGTPCAGFGRNGQVDLTQGVGDVERGEYEITSPPAVVNDVVVVGSAQGDNRRVEVERGTVRGFDVRTGALRWSWDPIPRSPDHPGWDTWTPDGAKRTGAANAWSIISADPERDLVFVPTGSAAPDFYGGERLGDNLFANSVVALRGSTGEMVWHFQVVHHDLWDYDVPAQPTLFEFRGDGAAIPAVAVATKMGHLFVLNRETGEPLFPVEERPVPPSTVPGERASPTQPFPVIPKPLHPVTVTPDDAWGLDDADRAYCRARIESLRNEGIFTPPSLEGTLMYPGFAGGMNWGGVAVHLDARILVTGIKRLPMWVRLHPREEYQQAERSEGVQFTGQGGTPYGMSRAPLLSPRGIPCTPPPWGTLAAVDLNTGDLLWEHPLGSLPQLRDVEGSGEWGAINFGGPIITAGNIVFVASSPDDQFRAFDLETGSLLWSTVLPAGGQATPMTYEVGGKQYVVIAAGGRDGIGTPGDYVVAFALP